MTKVRIPDPYPHKPEQLVRKVRKAQKELVHLEHQLKNCTELEKKELSRSLEYYQSRVKYYASFLRQFDKEGAFVDRRLEKYNRNYKKTESELSMDSRSVVINDETTNIEVTIKQPERDLKLAGFKPKFPLRSEIHLAVWIGLHVRDEIEKSEILKDNKMTESMKKVLELRSQLSKVWGEVRKKFAAREASSEVFNPFNRAKFENAKPVRTLSEISQEVQVRKKTLATNITTKNFQTHCQHIKTTYPHVQVPDPNCNTEIGFYNLEAHFDVKKPVSEKRFKCNENGVTLKQNSVDQLKKLVLMLDPAVGEKRPNPTICLNEEPTFKKLKKS